MRRSLAFFLLTPVSCLLGAIDGTIVNGTSGKPQAGVTISLVQPGAGGMQALATTKSDANGTFRLDHEVPPPPALLQADYQGITYTQVMPPNRPTTGVEFQVFDSSSKMPSGMQMAHLIMLEPSASSIEVTETFLIRNESAYTFQDSAKGTAQFFPPKAAGDRVQVTVTPPTQMAITRSAEKSAQSGEFKIDYPARPGETRFDMHYTLPASSTFSGKIVKGERPTTLVTPLSVTLSGEGLTPIEGDPQIRARLYEISAPSYEIKIEGTGSIREQTASAPEEDTGAPQTREILARVYDRMGWVLGLTFGILALGGALLYRKGAA